PQSMISALARDNPWPTAMILPSSTSTSPLPSRLVAGSSRRALVKSVLIALGSFGRRDVARFLAQRLEHRHAHGDAHLDLLADDAAIDIVGDFGVDLDAAIHRPRMHDERVGLGLGELVVVEAEEMEIFPQARHVAALHALQLQAQHHDDVDAFEALPHI